MKIYLTGYWQLVSMHTRDQGIQGGFQFMHAIPEIRTAGRGRREPTLEGHFLRFSSICHNTVQFDASPAGSNRQPSGEPGIAYPVYGFDWQKE